MRQQAPAEDEAGLSLSFEPRGLFSTHCARPLLIQHPTATYCWWRLTRHRVQTTTTSERARHVSHSSCPHQRARINHTRHCTPLVDATTTMPRRLSYWSELLLATATAISFLLGLLMPSPASCLVHAAAAGGLSAFAGGLPLAFPSGTSSSTASRSWGASPSPKGARVGASMLTRRSMLTVGHDAAVQTALPLLFGRWTLKVSSLSMAERVCVEIGHRKVTAVVREALFRPPYH